MPWESSTHRVLEPLGAASAVAGMMQLTYLAYLPEANGYRSRHFAQCAGVLNRCRAYRLIAPLGFEHMDSVLDLLEKTTLVS